MLTREALEGRVVEAAVAWSRADRACDLRSALLTKIEDRADQGLQEAPQEPPGVVLSEKDAFHLRAAIACTYNEPLASELRGVVDKVAGLASPDLLLQLDHAKSDFQVACRRVEDRETDLREAAHALADHIDDQASSEHTSQHGPLVTLVESVVENCQLRVQVRLHGYTIEHYTGAPEDVRRVAKIKAREVELVATALLRERGWRPSSP